MGVRERTCKRAGEEYIPFDTVNNNILLISKGKLSNLLSVNVYFIIYR